MKRNHTYEINLINKTVVVSKKFMEKATQHGSKEFKLLDNFQKMGLRIINQTRTKKAAKPEEGKLPLLTYKMMRDYLAMLDDADDRFHSRGWYHADDGENLHADVAEDRQDNRPSRSNAAYFQTHIHYIGCFLWY